MPYVFGMKSEAETCSSSVNSTPEVKAKLQWKDICKIILSKDKEKVRSFLQSVNSSMYMQLQQVGEKYYSSTFCESAEDSMMKNSLRSSLSIMEEDKKSGYLTEALDIIKKRIYQKVLQRSNKSEDETLDEEVSPTMYESIISPLIVLTRADQSTTIQNISPKKKFAKKLSNSFKLPRRKRDCSAAASLNPGNSEYIGFSRFYTNKSYLISRGRSLMKVNPRYTKR